MKIEKLSFESIGDLVYVMRRPMKTINFLPPEGMVKTMKSSRQKITVHLYPLRLHRKHPKCLLELGSWSYLQIYIALKEGKIFCCIGDGDTSGGREYHNHLIDSFLSERKLQKDVPTAVIVTYKNNVMAYYFYEKYAYSNHDIGSNWDLKIRDRLKKSGLPFSYQTWGGLRKKEVWFMGRNRHVLVYNTIREDIWGRNIDRKIKRMAARRRT